MATGGLIPTNREQTVTFYNTTPVVDKDKNIYYVPRFSQTSAQAGQQVRTAYLNAFEVVCPPSSDYTSIPISQWSPQDRTLVVRGNIDDFRVVTDEGACLNYFIITRTITKTSGQTSTSQTFYYAFFITDVKQAGGGSVQITAEPDDFTNVFYLHNTHELSASDITGDYEPFNKKLCNCYVKRQHYNRVSGKAFYNYFNCAVSENCTGTLTVGKQYHITTSETIPPVDYGNFYLISLAITHGEARMILADTDHTRSNVTIPALTVLRFSEVDSTNYTTAELQSWSKNASRSYETYNVDNMRIFMNQLETFKFKYQYRDSKYPISPYDGEFTDEEKDLIEEADFIDDLPSALQSKVLTTCINYLVIETKSTEPCKRYLRYTDSTQATVNYRPASGELVDEGINRPNPIICYPFINSPRVFKKFDLEHRTFLLPRINNILSTMLGQSGFPTRLSYYSNSISRTVIQYMNDGIWTDYILSAYVMNNVGIPNIYTLNIATVENTKVCQVIYDLYAPDISQGSPLGNSGFFEINTQNCYASGLRDMLTEGVQDEIYFYQDTPNASITSMEYPYTIGIIVSGYHEHDYNIDLSILGDIPSDLKTNYYDPVLETEPYKFYSISTLGNFELVFNKNRYYQTESVNLKYFYSVNGALKLSYIPNYSVDEIETMYFNEGLTFTSTTSLPLKTDSYISYYIQNKAQMKNQYAVTDKNFNYDMQQSYFVTAPASIASAGIRKGQIGVGSEFVNQTAKLINEVVDYYQSKEIISMNQRAKLADVGFAPDTLKQAGSDVFYDLKSDELFLFLNHYRIDELSYNSIAKLLERTGYQVDLYDALNVIDRVGWNYVQLISFDYRPTINIMASQEERIRQIFQNGVTLLHDKTYLASGHNYETLLG